MDEFKDLILAILVFWIIIGIVVFGSRTFQVICIDNVPVTVYVDNKEVYMGTSAGCKVDSTGRTTKVTILGGWLYYFPKAFYVSDNVKVIGEK